MTKRCSRCGVEKPLDCFTPQKGQRLGVTSYCKPCNAEYVRLRNQDPKVKAANAARTRERRKDLAIRDRDRATSAAWKTRNPAPAKPRRTPVQGSPEWYERRMWARRVTASRYHAREMGAVVNDLRLRDVLALVEQTNGVCFYCHREAPLTLEHKVPLCRGGDNALANIVLACDPCNRRKARRTHDEFVRNLCRNGHEQTPGNVYTNPAGSTFCRECTSASQERYKERKRRGLT